MNLVSTVVCEDVLANPAGRLTLYNTFRDLEADAFPARLTRFHVVTTWYNPEAVAAAGVVRVAITAAGELLIGDAVAEVGVPPGGYHTQVSRFRDLLLPGPGPYRVQVQVGARVLSDLPLWVVATPAAPPEPPQGG